ncbi:hypothetical protein G6011_01047 [Alternaria panax]|uniref:Protein kinase domain-containing protein n=1 Tax=Alternaria panax TaxID=48097 RepID=A0AAD4IJ56_9PLEO|nr:hypothetical protein G6011_01047 [Alternaria panax]
MYDDYIARSESDKNLRERLTGVVRQDEVEKIVDDFHKEKWEYCPLSLTLDMDKNLLGTRVILPFCSKIKLPDKGGTASIYWVAVQKDLISDSALAHALKDSLYVDGTYGECYEMVLKSYCGIRKRDFEMEKEAFSGLQSGEKIPILQCLGSYTHDYGEGKGLGKTYNLLLEYGENDLHQAWADETNVPPVQAQEILQNWKSLFEVAKAIGHVHNLEIQRGKSQQPWRFYGWHADIKPDNILSVRGRLKLADFGFSSFAPHIEGHGGSEPTELIRGFTDTYGAPEVSRMKKPDGTLSGVSQSIDAWSFGCVLSVAATWIVLGYQGLRQYERLRQLSPANNTSGHPLDRFHNGSRVLPEVGKWHDYLRGHVRSSDTTTKLVLELIEDRLLQADPTMRYTMKSLCERLQDLSYLAEHKIDMLEKHSRDPHPMVMKALSAIEEEAQIQRSSEPKLNLLQQLSLQVDPRQRASMQNHKEDMIRNKPLGQTTHRKEILEKKLEDCHVMKMVAESPASDDAHFGAVTDSPIDSTLLREPQFGGRKPKPQNPQSRAYDQGQPSGGPHTPNGAHHHVKPKLLATPPSSDRHVKTSGTSAELYSDDPYSADSPGVRLDFDPITRPSISAYTSLRQKTSTLQVSTTDSPTARYSTGLAQLNVTPKLLYTSEDDESLHPNRMQNAVERDLGEQASVISDPNPVGSPLGTQRIHEPMVGTFSPVRTDATSDHSITLSQPGNTQSSQDEPQTSRSSAHSHEKEAVERTSARSSDSFPQVLPQSALFLPYDICIKRRHMDEQVPRGILKGFEKMKGSFGIETRTQDASLRDTFSVQRELIFVVDNGWTMSAHWPIVTFVAQTLAKKAAGLDKSGFDLKFTVDGHIHNKKNLKGDSGRNKLKRALKATWPEYKPSSHVTTDMTRVFADVFQEWRREDQPATTLFVLTDGVWSNTDLDALNSIILDIARQDQLHAGNRHFSIQFIRFGDDDPGKARLQWLDDGLCVGNDLRDIIDHCSWRAEVDKMFKGSIESYLDEQDSDEKPILYDYKKLVELFNAFNKGENTAMLSPTSTVFRSSSRASQHSSASRPNSGDWTRKH